MLRSALIENLADAITLIKCEHPLRVAVDGIDAAGKTTLADELIGPLEKRGQDVIRASVDGFHNPRKIRYQQGKDSPAGYFMDSFDYDAIQEKLLKPLGPNGSLEYQTRVFDYRTDMRVDSPKLQALDHSILIFDGVFLLRPELLRYWDFKIFVDVDFSIAVERAVRRDQSQLATPEDIREQYWKRYIPGQKLYLAGGQPKEHADIVMNNDDPMKPNLI